MQHAFVRLFILVLFVLSFFVSGGFAQREPSVSPSKPGTTPDASVVIVVDTSDAGKKRFENIKYGVSTFLKSFKGENEKGESEICLLGAGAQPVLLEDFTTDISVVKSRLGKVKLGGKLALSDTLNAAADRLRGDAVSDSTAIVVFAAGTDDISKNLPATVPLDGPTSHRVPVYVITLPGTDWHAQERLQQLAVSSGGTAYFPTSTRQLKAVAEEAGQRLGGEQDSVENTVSGEKQKSKKQKVLAHYDQLIVRSIPVVESKNTTESTGGENVLLQNVLVSRLQKAKLFSEVIDGTGTEAPPPISQADQRPGNKVDMLPSIVEYRHGNRMQRQLIGWRGGAKFKVQVLLVDSATRKPVMSFTEEGSSSSGLFGGSQELVQTKAILDVVNGIIDELRRAK